MTEIKVAIMMGSKSDFSIMQEIGKVLKEFNVKFSYRVLSAHRTPHETAEYAEGLKASGVQVVICGAGMSAALAGVVSAHSDLPVIGVPIDASPLNGMDALLSTVQMPPGIPVAGVAIGKPGAKNAALIALRILGLQDAKISEQLAQFKKDQKEKILNTDLNS